MSSSNDAFRDSQRQQQRQAEIRFPLLPADAASLADRVRVTALRLASDLIESVAIRPRDPHGSDAVEIVVPCGAFEVRVAVRATSLPEEAFRGEASPSARPGPRELSDCELSVLVFLCDQRIRLSGSVILNRRAKVGEYSDKSISNALTSLVKLGYADTRRRTPCGYAATEAGRRLVLGMFAAAGGSGNEGDPKSRCQPSRNVSA